MDDNLPNERDYPHLAELLRAGGRLVIGEDFEFGSFASLRIGGTYLHVGKMKYGDLAEVLREMDSRARQYAELG
jgi:hypothetical protein